MIDEVIRELITQLKRHWQHPVACVLLLVIVLIVFLVLTTVVDFSKVTWGYAVLCLFVMAIAGVVWRRTTRCPRPIKGHIGFLVAIQAESKKQQQKLGQDFIETLRKLLEATASRYKYDLLVLSDYHARKIRTEDDAILYRKKTRSHFMIYGRVRERELNDKPFHVLDLEGLVGLRTVSDRLSKKLANEFSEVMPRNLKISHENDLLSFDFTANWMVVVAQYIIGIASFLSLDFVYSQELYESLRERLRGSDTLIPPIRKIQQRIPVRLAEVYLTRALILYRKWRTEPKLEIAQRMKELLDLHSKVDPMCYQGVTLRAFCYFVVDRNVDAALKELRVCRTERVEDATWRFSVAFLLAYRGELTQCLKQYQIAASKPCGDDVVMATESFLLWVLEEEPGCFAAHFCMGLVNHFVKRDAVRALEEFEAFLSKTVDSKSRFRDARQRVQVIIRELRKRLDTQPRPKN